MRKSALAMLVAGGLAATSTATAKDNSPDTNADHALRLMKIHLHVKAI
ncbi:MAG: hypothetical protein Q8P68_03180 [Candidatus Peregrinibacteria bacterium]|nr:hypothetical protein [Candidatus Peregrinibacteria bacterium]MDZ4244823.1 hypothetical protein [Candidatus Gracilibacteria bacterium]